MKKFNYLIYRATFIFAALLLAISVNATHERFYKALRGNSVSSGAILKHQDDKFQTMQVVPNWNNLFTHKKVTNTISLKYDKNSLTHLSSNTSTSVVLDIFYIDENMVSHTDNVTLNLSYDNSETANIIDHDSYVFHDGHHVKIKIASISGAPSGNVMILSSEIDVERFYTFNPVTTPTAPSASILTSTDNFDIELKWPRIKGAEEYDLEYVFINDYDEVSGYISSSNLEYDFKYNSTRVTVSENFYRIANTFEHGYLLYRVRGVSRYGDNKDKRWNGAWSCSNTGTVNSLSSKLALTTPFMTDDMNWSYQAIYTEGGRRFDGVSFSDGLMMGRQNLGRIATEDVTLVQEVYYDHQGRPAVTSLPAPDLDAHLNYRSDFNQNDAGDKYSREDFDMDGVDACVASTTALMDTLFGASKYYSSENDFQDGAQAFVPNANGFPFVRTEFTPDQTGRVLSQSGAGPDFLIGSTHSVKYEYGTPVAAQIDKLFGTDVGWHSKYQRNVVIDGNGQRSNTYIDPYGRVIATSLSGEAPSSLDALPSNTGSTQLTTEMLLASDDQDNTTVTELVFNKTFSVDDDGTYYFTYDMNPGQFEDACLINDVCFDCRYTMDFVIKDAMCGEVIFDYHTYINGATIDSLCNGLSSYSLPDDSLTVTLVAGSYILEKVLAVDIRDIETYTEMFIRNNDCLLTYQDFYDEILGATDFSGCDVTYCELSCLGELGTREDFIANEEGTGAEWDALFEACINSCYENEPCEDYKRAMMSDFVPGGQFGKITITQDSIYSAYPLSIYNPSNYLPNGDAFWREPVTPYLDPNGDTSYIVNIYGDSVVPQDTSIKLYQFIENFKFSWTESLLPYHPEYCYLAFCESNETSHKYDIKLLYTTSFEQALDSGMLNPVDMTTGQGLPDAAWDNNTHRDPFFFTGSGSSGLTSFRNYLSNYETYDNTSLNIWELAYFITYGNGTDTTDSDFTSLFTNYPSDFGDDSCTRDLLWANFKGLYLQAKKAYFDNFQANYAIVNGCYNGCFNTIAFDNSQHDFDCFPQNIAPNCPGGGGNFYYNANEDSDQPCSNGTASYYENIIPHFSDASVIDFYSMSHSQQYSFLEDSVASVNASHCDSMANQQADTWMAYLSGCGMNTTDSTNVRAEFIELCILACDNNHPMGAITLPSPDTTSNGNSSFYEILEYHLGGGFEDELCSDLLINSPLPYTTTSHFLNQNEIDTCACDKILSVKKRFYDGDSLPTGVETLEELYAFTYGLQIENFMTFDCHCEEAWNEVTGSAFDYNTPWNNDAATFLEGLDMLIPYGMGCETCVVCDSVTTWESEFTTRFSGLTEADSTYSILFENFMNRQTGFLLSYDDYRDFIIACDGTDIPVCEANQQLSELSLLLNQIIHTPAAMAGTSGSPYNLGNLSSFTGSLIPSLVPGSNFYTNYSSLSDKCHDDLTLTVGGGGSTCTIVLEQDGDQPGICWTKLTDISGGGLANINCNDEQDQLFVIATYATTGTTNGTSTAIFVQDTIWITSNCFPVGNCDCNEELTLCQPFMTPTTGLSPCVQNLYNHIEYEANEAYLNYINSIKQEFKDDYIAACIQAAEESEAIDFIFNSYEYHFTLYYYDQAGQLVSTVPPKGIDAIFSTTSVAANRPSGSQTVPSHTLRTEYRYNSFGQVIEQDSPDGGITKYWYDNKGRLVASQNAKQLAATTDEYSYVRYDEFGRVYEAGQVAYGTPPTQYAAYTTFETWLTSAGTKSQVTKTFYDESLSGVASQFLNGQNNLRLRVGTTAYYTTYSTDTGYDNAIHFSYDEHGNVYEQIQENKDSRLVQLGHDKKRIEYDYELVSGNVKHVMYQRDETDQWIHKYRYDRDNRLKEVFTSADSVVWDKDAKYIYYLHGPLARVERGEHKVQGEDYAYTINGWLKLYNANTLDVAHDMGNDGTTTGYLSSPATIHKRIGRDTVGFSLGYYFNDYKAISLPGVSSRPEARLGTTSAFNTGASELFNGNIRHMVNAIADLDQYGFAYHYDQLNRIKEMELYNGLNAASSQNEWQSSASITAHKHNFEYDANGNLSVLTRRGASLDMDDFDYSYISGTNQLDHVDDNSGYTTNFSDDIDDQATNNYTYTEIGELESDVTGGIASIEWRLDGKVKKVTRTGTEAQLEFEYDPFGRRILKISKPCAGGVPDTDQTTWTFTYYVNDASGNVMATYDYKRTIANYTMTVDEEMIYGSSRLGMRKRNKLLSTFAISGSVLTHDDADETQRSLGEKRYEYSNHLGNVLLVTTDRKMSIDAGTPDGTTDYYHAVIDAYYDYGPFGNVLDGRKGGSSRFGFQNQEKDNEIYGDNNSVNFAYRMHDTRLGRFMSVDPLAASYAYNSPYAFCENRVMDAFELEGLEAFFVHGTLGNTSFYTRKNNMLRTEIKKIFGNTSLPDYETAVHYQGNGARISEEVSNPELFAWSGFNNSCAREDAAYELFNHILKNRREGEPITLVGNSHGGNVVVMTAQMLYDYFGESVEINLVTLGTPSWPNEFDDYLAYQLSLPAALHINHYNIYNKKDKVVPKAGYKKYGRLQSGGETKNFLKIPKGEKASGEVSRSFYSAINIIVEDAFNDNFSNIFEDFTAYTTMHRQWQPLNAEVWLPKLSEAKILKDGIKLPEGKVILGSEKQKN